MSREPSNPQAVQAFERAIEARIRRDANTDVAAELKRAIELEPTCALLYHWLGAHYCSQRNFDDAAAALSEAIRLEPRFTAAYVLRDRCYEELGRSAEALGDRKKGLTLPGPKFVDLPGRFVMSLCSGRYVAEARKFGVDVDAVLRRIAKSSGARVLTYPDGTVQVEGEGAAAAFGADATSRAWKAAFQKAHAEDPLRMRMPLGSASYTSLSPFPARQIELAIWGEFAKRYEGGKLRVRPNMSSQPVGGRVNGPIDKLPVTVAVRRRFSKKTREQFAKLIGDYLASMRTAGMFGEGPVAQVSDAITFFPRVAQFRIDASHSGQNTFNWLILMLVGFSDVNLVTEIDFAEQVNAEWSFKRYYGLSSDEVVTLPIPEIETRAPIALSGADSSSEARLSVLRFEEEEPEAATPGDGDWAAAKPTYHGLRSAEFPVSTMSKFIPDDLLITIRFEELPLGGWRDKFTESIQAWLTLGQLGAFGPPGFNPVGDVDYDSEDDSVRFFCDAGPTDVDLALRILVNLLEQWHANGIVIKEVILGK